jgi:hypothetical protein
MNTGAEMPNITQKKEKSNRSRGRPARHESERMKTIAWYHFLAGERAPSEMCDWMPFDDIDQATIYRYRRGDISPRADILCANCEVFQAARTVFEVGPMNVPLWDALWGSITPDDFRIADRLMPGGDWPEGGLSQFFFEDVILARVFAFQTKCLRGRPDSVVSELECFVTAIRVVRAWDVLGQIKSTALRVLLEGLMSMPGTREILSRHGLVTSLKDWISAYFGSGSAAPAGTVYWAPWMTEQNELLKQQLRAEQHRMVVAKSLRAQLFQGDTAELDDFPVGGADDNSTWH